MRATSLIKTLPFIGAMLGISAASPIPDFPFIMADGRVEREVAPTNATVSFTVLTFSKTAEEATNTVQTTLTKVVILLKAEGITEKMIQAHDLDKSAVRKRTEATYSDTDILGYEVLRKVEVKLTDLTKFSKVVGILMTTDNITKVKSGFDTIKREEIEAELMGEACAEARRKANLLAKGAGVTIDRAFAVTDRTWRDLENLMDTVVYASGGIGFSGLPDLSPGTPETPLFVPSKITLQANVNILYKLTP